MSYSINISDDSTILTAVFSGDVVYSEIEGAGLDRLAHPESGAVSIWVTDYTDADRLVVSAEDVQRDLELAERVSRERPDLTIIAIMPDKFAYGMGRMWQGMAGDEPPVTAHIVQSREEADQLLEQIRTA